MGPHWLESPVHIAPGPPSGMSGFTHVPFGHVSAPLQSRSLTQDWPSTCATHRLVPPTSQVIAPQQSDGVLHAFPFGWQQATLPVEISFEQMESLPQHSAPEVQLAPNALHAVPPPPPPPPPPEPVSTQFPLLPHLPLQQSVSLRQFWGASTQTHLPSSSVPMVPQQLRSLPLELAP